MEKESISMAYNDKDCLELLIVSLVGRLVGVESYEIKFPLETEHLNLSAGVRMIIKSCNSLFSGELPEIPSYMLTKGSVFADVKSIIEKYNSSFNLAIDEILAVAKSSEGFVTIDSAIEDFVNQFNCILQSVDSQTEDFFVDGDYYYGDVGPLLYLIDVSRTFSDDAGTEYEILSSLVLGRRDLKKLLLNSYSMSARCYIDVLNDAIVELSESEAIDCLESALDSVFFPGDDDVLDMKISLCVKKLKTAAAKLTKGIDKIKYIIQQEMFAYNTEYSEDGELKY